VNVSEEQVATEYREMGYEVLRGGWPDLMAVRDGSVVLIEVKTEDDVVRPHQKQMHDVLEGLGFPVIVERVPRLTRAARPIGFASTG
jgi:VRR-NUC domain